jgi:hypothetical protein
MTYELRAVPKPPRRTPKAPKPLKRTRVKPYNARRGGHAFPRNVDEARRDFIRAQPCAVTGRFTGEWIKRERWMAQTLPVAWKCFVVVAHVKSRGSGGKDQGNMIPLDSRLHDWQGQIGWPTFQRRNNWQSRFEIAAEFERRYVERGGEAA